MYELKLEEYASYPGNVRLNKDQQHALTVDAHIEVTPSSDEDGAYRLKPSSYIGAINIGELAVVVRPKIPIDRVMFLITYAMDPKNWRRDPVVLDRDDDCLEAIVFAFAHRTRQAIQRGLLQGYRREEDALNTVRGRIRFGDQIGRRFAVPLPIEVAYDEYTEDIEKNRLLKTAIHLLGHTFIRSEAARQEVRRLRPAFATVGLGSYQRGALPEVRYTRLDEHYRPSCGTGAAYHRKLEPGAPSRQGCRRGLSHRYEQGIRTGSSMSRWARCSVSPNANGNTRRRSRWTRAAASL